MSRPLGCVGRCMCWGGCVRMCRRMWVWVCMDMGVCGCGHVRGRGRLHTCSPAVPHLFLHTLSNHQWPVV